MPRSTGRSGSNNYCHANADRERGRVERGAISILSAADFSAQPAHIGRRQGAGSGVQRSADCAGRVAKNSGNSSIQRVVRPGPDSFETAREAPRMADVALIVARRRCAASNCASVAVDGGLFGKFSAVGTFAMGHSPPRIATERSLGGRHDDLAVLIGAHERKSEVSARRTSKTSSSNDASRRKNFCVTRKFSQKRVAQFQQFRTTTSK